jgi:hypothetical protein
MSLSQSSEELMQYKSLSASYSAGDDEISLKMLAGDIVLHTRVKSDMNCDQFLRLQLKKVPHDDQKEYGLYLLKANKWLNENCPLFTYRSDLRNPKVSCELVYQLINIHLGNSRFDSKRTTTNRHQTSPYCRSTNKH